LEDCAEELKLVCPDGKIYGGMEAVVQAVLIRRSLIGKLAAVYYLPGIRSMADRAYRWVARNRFRFPAQADEACDGACGRHVDR
jgi:predicted DCC family thiol-disulfide oxidoreductase YuxK